MLACFRDRADLFVVRCFLCREEVPLHDSDNVLRGGKECHIFVCTPCDYRIKYGETLPRWGASPDPADEVDFDHGVDAALEAVSDYYRHDREDQAVLDQENTAYWKREGR
jgi:hypothetical protein